VTAALQLRTAVSAPTAALSLTSSPPAGISVDAAAGRIDVRMTAAQTGALSPRYYAYALELYWPDTRVERVLEGTLKVSPEVVK
jgi:hypothetical protein